MKKRWIILGLVTLFLISFSASAYFIINAKNLIFAENKQEITALLDQLDEKEAEITELKEQVDRYQTLYNAAVAMKTEVVTVTVQPSATAAPSGSAKPSGTITPSGTPTKSAAPVQTSAPTKAPSSATKKPETSGHGGLFNND